MMEEGRGTLDLVPIPAATGVVSLGPVESGGSGGVVDEEGYFFPAYKYLASNIKGRVSHGWLGCYQTSVRHRFKCGSWIGCGFTLG